MKHPRHITKRLFALVLNSFFLLQTAKADRNAKIEIIDPFPAWFAAEKVDLAICRAGYTSKFILANGQRAMMPQKRRSSPSRMTAVSTRRRDSRNGGPASAGVVPPQTSGAT